MSRVFCVFVPLFPYFFQAPFACTLVAGCLDLTSGETESSSPVASARVCASPMSASMLSLMALISIDAGPLRWSRVQQVVVELFALLLAFRLILRELRGHEHVNCHIRANEDLQHRHLVEGVQSGLRPRLVLVHTRLLVLAGSGSKIRWYASVRSMPSSHDTHDDLILPIDPSNSTLYSTSSCRAVHPPL